MCAKRTHITSAERFFQLSSEVEVVSLFLKIQHIFEIVFLCIHILFLSIKKNVNMLKVAIYTRNKIS